MGRIKIEVEEDRMGMLTLTPVSQKLQRRIERYLDEWNVSWVGSVLIQREDNIESFMADQLSSAQRGEVREGWGVTILMDPWTFGHYIGWDAHDGVNWG